MKSLLSTMVIVAAFATFVSACSPTAGQAPVAPVPASETGGVGIPAGAMVEDATTAPADSMMKDESMASEDSMMADDSMKKSEGQ